MLKRKYLKIKFPKHQVVVEVRSNGDVTGFNTRKNRRGRIVVRALSKDEVVPDDTDGIYLDAQGLCSTGTEELTREQFLELTEKLKLIIVDSYV